MTTELTKEQEIQLLINLMEEAGEVVQAASKWLRFGPDSCSPKDETKTIHRILLAREIGNLLGIASILSEYHFIHDNDIRDGIEKKANAMIQYGVVPE